MVEACKAQNPEKLSSDNLLCALRVSATMHRRSLENLPLSYGRYA